MGLLIHGVWMVYGSRVAAFVHCGGWLGRTVGRDGRFMVVMGSRNGLWLVVVMVVLWL